MIRISNVHKSFETNKVLDNISLDIEDADTFVIVGKSGIGKSVLLKCITRLIDADTGIIYIDDEDITAASRNDLLRIRWKIGMVLQEGALFDSMNVFENVAFPLIYHKLAPMNEIRKKVFRFLDLVEMSEFVHSFPAELSGGMKRKVSLARAMIMEPKYLLYDEPTSGLDPESAGIVESLILKLKQELKITSLIVTHDIDLAKYVGEKIALLENGTITTIMTKETAFLPTSVIYKHFISNRERVHKNNENQF
ncbi:MAG: ATP-binding cassette domain-containing protein [Spirochaetales bacterium]|nr:ATP-binding cassette domain-containing protein [Spirochaetales bacterium]